MRNDYRTRANGLPITCETAVYQLCNREWRRGLSPRPVVGARPGVVKPAARDSADSGFP